MPDKIKNKIVSLLRWSERYTKTDMLYLTKNSFWMNLNTIIVTILSFILSILFANYVSKETYGTYQFLLSISSILGALTLTGMNVAVGQAVSRGFEGVLKESVKIQINFGLIPLAVGMFIGLYYLIQGNLTLAIPIMLMGALIPTTNALNTWGAYMTGKKLFKPIFSYSQIINILYYGAIIIPIIFFPSVIPLIFFNIASGLVANIIAYFHILKKYPPNNKNELEATSYGKKLSLSNILPQAAYHIDNIIVFHLLGARDLAIYSFASNIPDRFMSLLRPIPAISFPKFSEKPPQEVSKILPKKVLQLSIITFIGGIFYILIAPLVFNTFFPQYSESVLYSQVYVFVSVLSLITSLSTTALFATRSSNIYIINIINPIFSITTLIVGGYFFGIWGVITARIIGNAFNLGINTYFGAKEKT